MYLVDTNVISAAAPTTISQNLALVDWMERHSADLYVSVITIAEIDAGIAKARRDGSSRKADNLWAWLETMLHLYSARILPVDVRVARVIGALSDQARACGQSPGLADVSIAATATAWGYTVLTRNLRHFTWCGVAAFDPFAQLP